MIGPADRRSWLIAALIAAFVALLLFLALRAQFFDRALAYGFRIVQGDRSGNIVWTSTDFTAEDPGWVLNAHAEIALPTAVAAGLDSGIPLHFLVELEPQYDGSVSLPWRGERVVRRYSIAYYGLTSHYRVHNQSDGLYQNYRSLRSALDGLGQFTNVYFDEIDSERQLQAVKLSMRLDTRRLPLPLQPLLRSPWRLASERMVWRLD